MNECHKNLHPDSVVLMFIYCSWQFIVSLLLTEFTRICAELAHKTALIQCLLFPGKLPVQNVFDLVPNYKAVLIFQMMSFGKKFLSCLKVKKIGTMRVY